MRLKPIVDAAAGLAICLAAIGWVIDVAGFAPKSPNVPWSLVEVGSFVAVPLAVVWLGIAVVRSYRKTERDAFRHAAIQHLELMRRRYGARLDEACIVIPVGGSGRLNPAAAAEFPDFFSARRQQHSLATNGIVSHIFHKESGTPMEDLTISNAT